MKLWIGVLSLLGGSLVVQTGYRYQSEDFGLLEVAGACSVSAEEVKCWEPTGKPNAKLSELVTAHFLANPSNEMRLRFRKRNRLLVMRTIARQSAKVSFYGELEGDSGARTSQSGSIGHESGQESYKLYWYYPGDDQKVTDLTAQLNTQLSSGSTLPLKEGAEAKLGAYSIKIEGVAEASPSESQGMGYGSVGKLWKVAYSITGPIDQEWPQLQATPMDAKGLVITAVDKNGNPTKPSEGSGGFGPYSYQQFYGGSWQGGNIGTWYSRIRPDKVGRLVLNGSTKRKIVFKDVALEPSQ